MDCFKVKRYAGKPIGVGEHSRGFTDRSATEEASAEVCIENSAAQVGTEVKADGLPSAASRQKYFRESLGGL